MDVYKKITIDDIWIAPKGDQPWKLKSSGCDFIDVLSHRVVNEQHRNSEAWAKRMGVRPCDIYAAVKTLTGMTANKWIGELEVRRLSYMLVNTVKPLSEIASSAGFSSTNTMLKYFQRHTGQTPRKYRNANQRVRSIVVKEIIK
jgi:transcriptional regulator GlxA family with amidase domain